MITWKLPSYDLAIDSGVVSGDLAALGSEAGAMGSNPESLRNDGEDIFGKNPGSGDQSVNISSKNDERTSLLPDGTRANKSQGGLLIGQQPDKNGQQPEDTQSAAKNIPDETHSKGEGEESEDKPLTRQEIYRRREEVVDKVLISAVKTLAQLQRASDLMAYSRHPHIIKTFADKYVISISFALHVGRAIEGAIGSEFKVDALYLSADTQISLRIDSLCDTYDRQILMSGDFFKMVSPKGKTFCRKIDQVCMTETRSQMKEIFCFDIFPSDPLEEDQKSEDDIPNGKFICHMDFENQDTSFMMK